MAIDMVQLVVVLRTITELTGLIMRAVREGRTEVSRQEIGQAFIRADKAESNWQDANKAG